MRKAWAVCRLQVMPQVNTEQLLEFSKQHPGDTPGFSLEVPVHGMEDEVLEEAWGTSSLPEALRPRVSRTGFLQYMFKTRCTPPSRWVSRVAKRYGDLGFLLSYAIPEVLVVGEYWRFQGVTRTLEVEGSQKDVDEFLLSVE